jgi:hypothetical protein
MIILLLAAGFVLCKGTCESRERREGRKNAPSDASTVREENAKGGDGFIKNTS